jgi:lipoyl-dependent peroxiredoxin
MSKITKVLCTGKTRTSGVDTAIISGNHEGRVNIRLSVPGSPTAPEYAYDAVEPHPTAEQLFAGAWSACYIAALGVAAKAKRVTLPLETAVEIEVDLGMSGSAYLIQARLNLSAPGLDHDVALDLVHAADALCPYSKATRGNIDVVLDAVTRESGAMLSAGAA